jgi:4,5-dihydroxyphthalate decarboxylase
MPALKLSFSCWNYDRMQALMDGRVRPEGIELTYEPLFPAVTFQRALREGHFDACELGLTFYLATLHMPDPPFVAIPVFPVRLFVHSAIFVNAKSGVREPKDLIGKRVGELFVYGHDAGTFAKGVLADEYGVPADSYSYSIGGVDRPMGEWEWFPLKPPPNVRWQHIGAERTLDRMLETGEIDALVSALVPPSYLKRDGTVRRLFADTEAVERAYFRKTGIFPIMHIVAIRKEVYRNNPWVAQSLYQALKDSKDKARELYRMQEANMHRLFMVPWLTEHREQNEELMGDDLWPYGLERNRKALDTFLRYHHEQGVSKRRFTPEELFVPETRGD